MKMSNNTKTKRALFLDCVNFIPGGRPLLAQTLWLMKGVKEEWEKDGITSNDVQNLMSHTDDYARNISINTHIYPPFETKIVKETEEYIILKNNFGAIGKIIKRISDRPIFFDFPVKNIADWQKLKERFAWQQERCSPDWVKNNKNHAENGFALKLNLHGFYGFPRELIGDEQLCMAYYDCPEMIHDMAKTYCQLAIDAAEYIKKVGIQVDIVYFWEDLAGKTGPIIGPRQFKEFIIPYYQKVVEKFRQLGVSCFEVDSDGNLDLVIPLFMEAGVNCLTPFECQAGMDVVKVRQKYPRLIIHGGLDKKVFIKDKKAIDEELDYKLPPMIESGGYMAGIDHRVLAGTTFENFSYYIKRVAKMFGII